MNIDVSMLNKTKGGTDFSYNDRAEDAINNAVCYYHDLQANGGTIGFDPSYDKVINRTKVEIKVTSNGALYLEVAKYDGTPSGIFASEADVYLTVSPGQDKGKHCMKVRLYQKRELEHWAKHMLEKHEDKIKIYKPDKLGPGSMGFMLEFKAVNDLYILGFEYTKDAQDHIVFDTHKVLLPSAYAKNSINQYIK